MTFLVLTVHNEVLLDLPQREADLILPQLEHIDMKPGQILHQPGDRLKSAYFINGGLISILSALPNGKSVAVAMVGKQGFIGLPLLAGFRSASTRAVVTVEASVLRISVDVLLPLLELRQTLFRLLTRFNQILAMEIAQLSGCNRFHDGQHRLARYLLMSADRTGSNQLPLTQEVLADLLGTRRSSVTVAAGALEHEGLIALTRANIEIVSREGLEQACCVCYEQMRKRATEWCKNSE